MQAIIIETAIELIEVEDERYARDAYLFIHEALGLAQATVALASSGRLAHATSQELLDGIRDLALAQFGPMAPMVFDGWGIHSCRDFGEIVHNMVEIGLLASSEEDCQNDFEDGFDFEEAFHKPF